MAVLGATNLTGCNSIPDFIAGGSLVTFQQTAAPTSWTKQTSHDNKALRVVSGTASSGGSTAFTSVFASRAIPNHTLSVAQLASHAHRPLAAAIVQSWGVAPGSSAFPAAIGGSTTVNNAADTGSAGSNSAHGHGSLDFAVQYVDLIICSKN
jgi:hypothetical protein